ncbi:hypothetical protein [Streptomyces boncukensis]|uniref:Uncharacterized protein n=1 Tax=Streptomyces boncukensis TaxID=2711219 RepID=A0A6G4WRR0_9ACTN|nr:hypothetical protein [Streptomyces boncukensis]NGO67181.1 hypothetical protein [Streptomyces boncukensis]
MERRRFVATALGAASAGLVAGAASAAPAQARTQGVRARAEWRPVPAPGADPGAQLLQTVALDASLAWAVGEESRGSADERGRPLAMRWNGARWTRSELSDAAFTGGLRSVAATSPGDVWAVGSAESGPGRILRFNGTRWRAVDYPHTPDTRLWAVAAGPDRQVWVTGLHEGAARLLNWNGVRWRWLDPLPVDRPEYADLTSVTVREQGDVWVSGSQTVEAAWVGLVARWDGRWAVLPGTGGIRSGISGVLPLAKNDVWAVGAAFGVGGPPGKPPGAVLVHWDGTEWTSAPKDIGPGALTGIAGDGQGRPGWICGWEFWDQSRTAYLRWDGGAWKLVRGPADEAVPNPYLSGVTRVPGGGYLSVGRTHHGTGPSVAPYSETTLPG